MAAAGLAASLPPSIKTTGGGSLAVTGVAEDQGGVSFRAGPAQVRLHWRGGGANAHQNTAAKFWSGDAGKLKGAFAGLGAGALLDVTPKFHRREQRLSIEPPCSGEGFCPSPKHQIVHLYKSSDGALRLVVLSEGFVQVVRDSPKAGGDPTVRIEQGPSRPVVSARTELCGRPVFFFIDTGNKPPGGLAKGDLRRIAQQSADIMAQVSDAVRAGACA